MIEVETKYHVGYCQFDDINEANDYMKMLRERADAQSKLSAEKDKRKAELIALNNHLNDAIKQYNKDYGTQFSPYYSLTGICKTITGVLDSE